MKIEIDVQIPEGYEATGDYRIPRKGDEGWIDICGNVSFTGYSAYHSIILSKKKKVPLYRSMAGTEIMFILTSPNVLVRGRGETLWSHIASLTIGHILSNPMYYVYAYVYKDGKSASISEPHEFEVIDE